jgi:hypothetical protein
MDETGYRERRTSGVDHSPWRSILELVKVAGKWWFFVWVLVVLAGLVALGLTIVHPAQVPTAVWVSLFVVGIVIAPMVAFHFVRVERDTFYALWHDKETLMNVLVAVEELRQEAAPLHIRGMRLATTRSVNKWIKEVDNWTERAVDTVQLLHPAEAGNLRTLGVFPVQLASATKPLNSNHRAAIQNLVRRMAILADIRDRWTTQGAA